MGWCFRGRRACGFSCNTGFADCDGNAVNGCEVDTRSTVAHCGGCGRVCAPANATGACAMGACTIGVCNATFANCDGSAANGCEVNTAINDMNCGRCGNACPAEQICSGGVCTPVVTISAIGRADGQREAFASMTCFAMNQHRTRLADCAREGTGADRARREKEDEV